MDEEQKTVKEKPKESPKTPKKLFSNVTLVILLVLVLSAAFSCAAFWWRDKIANDFEEQQAARISSLEKTVAAMSKQIASKASDGTADGTVTECNPQMPSTATIENVKASITSGNTAALEGYMADSVNVILAATEAYGAQTPAQAVSDVTSFISDTTSPWDFLLPASVLSSYGQGGYGQYFPNIDTVGKSADGKVISFTFDCDAKISTVFMAGSEELLN